MRVVFQQDYDPRRHLPHFLFQQFADSCDHDVAPAQRLCAVDHARRIYLRAARARGGIHRQIWESLPAGAHSHGEIRSALQLPRAHGGHDRCGADAAFVPVHELPESALEFLLPSRYCQSDLLNDLASSIVGKKPPGYPQVAAIEQWLRDEMKYVRGASNATTSAVETAKAKSGVCRDYAHLGIALTRSLNIPARMVVGYLYSWSRWTFMRGSRRSSAGAGSLSMACKSKLAAIAS